MKTRIVLLVCLLILTLPVVHSYAADIIVQPGQSIQNAIDSAQAGDTVTVLVGTYDQGDIVMKDGVNLVGSHYMGEEVTVVGTITTANSTELKRINVKNTAAGNIGRGIIVPSQNVSIKNMVVFVGNHTDYDRGISLNGAGSVTIESCTVHVKADPNALIKDSTACVYSENSNYSVKNCTLTLNDPTLNAINANNDTPEISYNCILGKISPLTLQHKGTIAASPGYKDADNGDLRLAMAQDNQYRSPSVALDSGCPALSFYDEIQLTSVNKAIDIGGYGNTTHTAITTIGGDFNLDGKVDVSDLGILATNYGKSNMAWRQGDSNDDGKVDVSDLGILAYNYGKTVPGM